MTCSLHASCVPVIKVKDTEIIKKNQFMAIQTSTWDRRRDIFLSTIFLIFSKSELFLLTKEKMMT